MKLFISLLIILIPNFTLAKKEAAELITDRPDQT